jgi:hypothetical protein
MKKIVKINESDLIRIVKKVLQEQKEKKIIKIRNIDKPKYSIKNEEGKSILNTASVSYRGSDTVTASLRAGDYFTRERVYVEIEIPKELELDGRSINQLSPMEIPKLKNNTLKFVILLSKNGEYGVSIRCLNMEEDYLNLYVTALEGDGVNVINKLKK